jgi:hypothetical protein
LCPFPKNAATPRTVATFTTSTTQVFPLPGVAIVPVRNQKRCVVFVNFCFLVFKVPWFFVFAFHFSQLASPSFLNSQSPFFFFNSIYMKIHTLFLTSICFSSFLR